MTSKRNDYLYLFWYSLIALIGIVYLFSSCNANKQMAKKIEKGYETVGMFSPQTSKDSGNFYKRADDLIKQKDSIVVKSTIVKVPYPVEKLTKVLDSATLQHIVDSLEIAHSNDLNNEVDDCMESVKKAREEGISAGYKQGQYETWINGRDSMTPEIHYFPDPSLIEKVDAANFKLRSVQDQLVVSNAKNELLKNAGTKKNWGLGILIFLLGAVTFLKVKSFVKPTIISDALKNI